MSKPKLDVLISGPPEISRESVAHLITEMLQHLEVEAENKTPGAKQVRQHFQEYGEERLAILRGVKVVVRAG
jgi:hypothetical protein